MSKSQLVAARAASGQQQQQQQQQQLVAPYQFQQKSLVLRMLYGHMFGYSFFWLPKDALGMQYMLQPIKEAASFLGFGEYQLKSAFGAALSCPQHCLTSRITETPLTLAKNAVLSIMWLKPPEILWQKLANFLVFRLGDHLHKNITNKWNLFENLQNADQNLRLLTASGELFKSVDYLPKTLKFGISIELLSKELAEQPGWYVMKPVFGCKGMDIQLVNCNKDQKQLENLLEKLEQSRQRGLRLQDVILQKYIEAPLLADTRKQDCRIYLLIVNARRINRQSKQLEQATFAFFHPGFVRLCLMPYKPPDADLVKAGALAPSWQLTNQFVQMQHPLYEVLGESTVWLPNELNSYCNRRGLVPEYDYVQDHIYPQMRAISGYVTEAFLSDINDSHLCTSCSTFKIFGLDFLIDNNLRVHLLEVNDLPSIKMQLPLLQSLKPDIIREALSISIECVIKYRKFEELLPMSSVTNFRLVYSTLHQEVLPELIKKHFK